MQTSWQEDKRPIYLRDMLRDYCLTAAELEAQFARFHATGTLSYSIMRGIMGDEFSKGLLWHLKDSAHHLFKDGAESSAGAALDWAVGFLFHECVIILESSYQLQKYYPAAKAMIMEAGEGKASAVSGLKGVRRVLLEQAAYTQDTLSSMVARAEKLLSAINGIFCYYLAGEADNRHLARLIYDREELLRSVFKELYPKLLQIIYGETQEKLMLEAARSLLDGGRAAKARRAADRALDINPQCAEARALLDEIAAMV